MLQEVTRLQEVVGQQEVTRLKEVTRLQAFAAQEENDPTACTIAWSISQRTLNVETYYNYTTMSFLL